MRRNYRTAAYILTAGAAILLASPASAFAQGRENKKPAPADATASITFGDDIRILIRDFYAAREPRGVESLPPGIRKRLARGKPLPPGIAKQVAPDGLRSRIHLPHGYEIVEVGLDVLLVEVGTAIVRDVLRDVVR